MTLRIANRARAEQLAQDVFVKVRKSLPHFRGDARLSTWIYRIVVNVIVQERQELAAASLDDPPIKTLYGYTILRRWCGHF